MPCKLDTFCYVQDCTERIARDYTVKEITGVVRMDRNDSTKIIYLQIKAFIPLGEQLADSKIQDFEVNDIIYLKGKFIGCPNYYLVRL